MRSSTPQWRDQVERLRQAEAIDNATDPETKSLLASPGAWAQMREIGVIGPMVGFGLSTIWMTWLLKFFAVDLNMGWLSAVFLPFRYRSPGTLVVVCGNAPRCRA